MGQNPYCSIVSAKIDGVTVTSCGHEIFLLIYLTPYQILCKIECHLHGYENRSIFSPSGVGVGVVATPQHPP